MIGRLFMQTSKISQIACGDKIKLLTKEGKARAEKDSKKVKCCNTCSLDFEKYCRGRQCPKLRRV